MQVQYKFTETELKKLLKENLVIIVDTREQENEHILDYFNSKKIRYEVKKIDAGDYSVKLAANPELGIFRDCYIPVMIEKKNSIDELASSFKDRVRFENEFIRATASKYKIHLLVEDGNGYENILRKNYRSMYDPKALLGSLKTFESRYDFYTSFLDKKYVGNFIYYTLYYHCREYLIS